MATVGLSNSLISHLGSARSSQPMRTPTAAHVAVRVSRSLSVRDTSRMNGSRLMASFSGSEGEAVKEEETAVEFKYPAFPTVMDINQIIEVLPHRFPFLLVDRVVEFTSGVSIVAIKNVTINDNFFPGHFPERPIMPGVLMVEALAQVGGILLSKSGDADAGSIFYFAGIDKVRFRKPVIAGDTLVMRMTLTKLQKRFGIAKLDGKAYVGGEVVCEGEFLLTTGT